MVDVPDGEISLVSIKGFFTITRNSVIRMSAEASY